MKIMPIASSNPVQQNKQQNFKSKFVANEVLAGAFKEAEKNGCRYFLTSMKNLMKDGLNRTIELSGAILVSKDGIMYTKTKLKTENEEKEYVGFPHIYGNTTEEMIANDARLLVIDAAKLYSYPDYKEMSKDEIRGELRELKKQIFQK